MLTIDQARQWYPDSDPIHGFDHIQRVVATAGCIAEMEGADQEIVRYAALLHDASPVKAERHNHHLSSSEFAGEILTQLGWEPARIAAVQHCIRAHRFRDDSEQPQTLEAKILFDADKLDAIGAIGVARAIAYAARAGQPAYAPPSASFLETGQLEPGEPHSAYHEYIFKLSRLKQRIYTAAAARIADERHAFMQEFFQRLASEMNGIGEK